MPVPWHCWQVTLKLAPPPCSPIGSLPTAKIKPKGFWFSVEGNEDGWKHWCEAESFETKSFMFENEIFFGDEAMIAVLSSVLDIDIFHQRYKAALAGREHYIDWKRVARECQGIIIAPYVCERRLDGDASEWYYGWDCASGCVWDASAIQEVKTVNYRK